MNKSELLVEYKNFLQYWNNEINNLLVSENFNVLTYYNYDKLILAKTLVEDFINDLNKLE